MDCGSVGRNVCFAIDNSFLKDSISALFDKLSFSIPNRPDFILFFNMISKIEYY